MGTKRKGTASFVRRVLRATGHRVTGFCAGVIILTWGVVSAAATTWNVSPTNTGHACSAPADPYCTTIQGAINAASTGDVINVFPGTYSETADVPSSIGCSGDTVGLYIATNGITIQGVDGGGARITDPTLAAATVDTNSNLCFGPDGFLITGDNVTIAGIRVGTNTGGQNKTIEIWGDNFTLKNCDIADVQGSVYFNDATPITGCSGPLATSSHIQTYTIQGNIFEDAVSLDITNGAGLSGPVSGRVVSGNTFNNLATTVGAEPWPSVSFDGSGTGVAWFVCSVGGATITGNTFSNSAPDGQLIRARGTYDNSQFNWASYWSNNTFNKAAVVGPTPPSGLETYSYSYITGQSCTTSADCAGGAVGETCVANACTDTFNNVRRIGAIIQGEVDNGLANDTVLVAAGTYNEQVVVNKSLTLQGAGAGASIIQAPAVLAGDASGFKNIVTITGGGVSAEISGFAVTGPGPGACGSINTGIFVRDGATANIHDNTIADIRDNPLSGCQNGQGIFVGRKAFSTTGTATITKNLITGYQKGGIVVDNTASTATITGNTVTGVGATTQIAQNGIQISRGAVATVSGNSVSGNLCNHSSCGPDPVNQDSSVGILLYEAGSGTNVSGNPVSDNDVGVYNQADGAVISGNEVTGNRYEGIFLDEGDATVTLNTIDGGNIGVAAVSFTDNTENSSGTLSCNRITAAGTGIKLLDQDTTDSYVPTVTADQNAIEGNGAGLVNTTTTAVTAQNNWWGCVAGPGHAGCDTVTGSVNVTPVSPSVPGCVSCTADVDCNDGKACVGPTNPSETCNTGTNMCQVPVPAVCSLGAAPPQCNEAVCVEPGGCTVQPTAAGLPCNCGTNECPGDTCDGTGMCLSPTSLNVSYAQPMLTTRLGKTMGSVAMRGVVDDSDTGGDLKTRLQAGTVSLQVQDSGSFNTTVSLTGCHVRGQGIFCGTQTMTAHFIPMTPKRTPYRYQMGVASQRLGIGSTGYKPLIPPLTVTLHQGALIRSDDMSSCKVSRLQMSMICRGS